MPDHPATTPTYKAVLFDLDNTLVDRDEALTRIANALYDAQPTIHATLGRSATVDRFLALDEGGLAGRDRLMQRTLGEWPGITQTHAEMLDWYGTLYGLSFRLEPSVDTMLRDLTKRSVPWGIVTNGSANQQETIDAVGFGKLTSCVVISGIAKVSKPDPKIFLQALASLSVEPGRDILFAGDNPVADIGGAHAIGMSTAWVRRGREWTEPSFAPDHQVDHVSELANLFA